MLFIGSATLHEIQNHPVQLQEQFCRCLERTEGNASDLPPSWTGLGAEPPRCMSEAGPVHLYSPVRLDPVYSVLRARQCPHL